jgi:hypothetical protein
VAEETVSVRRHLLWGAIAFGVALALVIGIRLDQAALAVVAGVTCGVGASIPTGLLVVFLLRRRDAAASERRRARRYGREPASPPVVVVTPSSAPQLPQGTAWPGAPGAYGAPLPAQREFAVIGEEGVEDEFDLWQAFS